MFVKKITNSKRVAELIFILFTNVNVIVIQPMIDCITMRPSFT